MNDKHTNKTKIGKVNKSLIDKEVTKTFESKINFHTTKSNTKSQTTELQKVTQCELTSAKLINAETKKQTLNNVKVRLQTKRKTDIVPVTNKVFKSAKRVNQPKTEIVESSPKLSARNIRSFTTIKPSTEHIEHVTQKAKIIDEKLDYLFFGKKNI